MRNKPVTAPYVQYRSRLGDKGIERLHKFIDASRMRKFTVESAVYFRET
jgi:hypothetical protein